MRPTFGVVLLAQEDGSWIADVPSMPGCFGQGASQKEAMRKAHHVLLLYLESFGLGAMRPQPTW